MDALQSGWLIIAIAIVAANLPWISEKIFFIGRPAEGKKSAWWRWLEWLVLYLLTGAITFGLENKLNGEIYPQDWEFYAVTFCLFLVFALPGFIFRHDLMHHLQRR